MLRLDYNKNLGCMIYALSVQRIDRNLLALFPSRLNKQSLYDFLLQAYDTVYNLVICEITFRRFEIA